MKALFALLLLLCCAVVTNAAEQKDLGGMEPAQALEYMKTTPDLIIVDVATKSGFERIHFANAINIPIENISSAEAKTLYMQIPAGRPVILHCRLGMIVPGAYHTLKNLRQDIPEISYIAGKPSFEAYNAIMNGGD